MPNLTSPSFSKCLCSCWGVPRIVRGWNISRETLKKAISKSEVSHTAYLGSGGSQSEKPSDVRRKTLHPAAGNHGGIMRGAAGVSMFVRVTLNLNSRSWLSFQVSADLCVLCVACS